MFLILVNTLFDTFGWSTVLPTFPILTERFGMSAGVIGSIMSFTSAISFIIGPILCRASDTYGRSNILIINSSSVLLGLIITASSTNSTTFAIGRILPSLFKCGMGVPNAYAADVSHNDIELLAKNLGRIQAVMSLGMIVGPIIGGKLASMDAMYPFYFASFAMILSVVFLMFVKESKVHNKIQHKRRSSILTSSNIFTSLSSFHLLHTKLAFQIGNGIFELFLVTHVRKQLKLDESSMGYILSFYGLLSFITNSILIPIIPSKVSTNMYYVICMIVIHSIGLLLWGLGSNIIVVFIAIALVCVSANVFLNVLTSVIAERGDTSTAGTTMGINAMVDRAARIVAPLIGGFTMSDSSPLSIGVASFCFGMYCLALQLVGVALFRRESHQFEKKKDI